MKRVSFKRGEVVQLIENIISERSGEIDVHKKVKGEILAIFSDAPEYETLHIKWGSSYEYKFRKNSGSQIKLFCEK